jgi:hypothetical protein
VPDIALQPRAGDTLSRSECRPAGAFAIRTRGQLSTGLRCVATGMPPLPGALAEIPWSHHRRSNSSADGEADREESEAARKGHVRDFAADCSVGFAEAEVRSEAVPEPEAGGRGEGCEQPEVPAG